MDCIQQPVNNVVTVYSIDESSNNWTPLFTTSNLVSYKWAFIIAKAWAQGNMAYSAAGMYFEYYNTASPGDLVTVPSYTRGDQLTYYTSLASPGDYLRVPLSGLPSLTIQPGYESYFNSAAGEGNVITFSAQTSGTTGQLGRAFASGSNSTVFGVALISTPTWSDATKDIIFARTYFPTSPTNQQQLKQSGKQIGVTWSIPLL